MKKPRFTDSQMISILKQAKGGSRCRSCAASMASARPLLQVALEVRRDGGSVMVLLTELEEENRRLKKMYA